MLGPTRDEQLVLVGGGAGRRLAAPGVTRGPRHRWRAVVRERVDQGHALSPVAFDPLSSDRVLVIYDSSGPI